MRATKLAALTRRRAESISASLRNGCCACRPMPSPRSRHPRRCSGLRSRCHPQTAEQGVLILCRGVLLVAELAFPAAVRGGVGAEIIEERVAAEDAAVLQQHHAGLP